MAKPDSKLIQAVSGGWPHILASLKSLLETGSRWQKPAAGPKGFEGGRIIGQFSRRFDVLMESTIFLC
jgi:hypothetical protein